MQRPLLQAITDQNASPVLLIDEVDRADEEFEAFLLELLSDFQITIPELGTLQAKHKPFVILTSNRTRELSDALKRRCLYYWVDYPDRQRELRIVESRLPDVESSLANQVVGLVRTLRQQKLAKPPGVAETLDWTSALMALGLHQVDPTVLERTIGCVLKSKEDIQQCQNAGLEDLLSESAAP